MTRTTSELHDYAGPLAPAVTLARVECMRMVDRIVPPSVMLPLFPAKRCGCAVVFRERDERGNRGGLPHPARSFRVANGTCRRSFCTIKRGDVPSSRNKPYPEPSRDVPAVVVSRLSLYLRELRQLVREGRSTVSSSQLGKMLCVTDAQVRKDLA